VTRHLSATSELMIWRPICQLAGGKIGLERQSSARRW
jgi:hypothetical protein